MKDSANCPGLLHLDSGRGLRLPYNLQEKWLMKGARYKEKHQVTFPPFRVFSEFVRYQAKVCSDPSFMMPHYLKQYDMPKRAVNVRATEVKTANQQKAGERCPIHKKNHSILKCRVFLAKSPPEKKAISKGAPPVFQLLPATTCSP